VARGCGHAPSFPHAAHPHGCRRSPGHTGQPVAAGDELRALRRLQRESKPSPFVFVSDRGTPFTTAGFARMIERVAVGAGLELKAHPHMLRHACGYALANKGHDPRAISGKVGASLDHEHRGLYGRGAEPVQGFLAGVRTVRSIGLTRLSARSSTFSSTAICRRYPHQGLLIRFWTKMDGLCRDTAAQRRRCDANTNNTHDTPQYVRAPVNRAACASPNAGGQALSTLS
jgi:hypothetical protein